MTINRFAIATSGWLRNVMGKFKNMQKRLLLTILTFISVYPSIGQTHDIDTIVDGKHYTFANYYDNGKILSLGNYNDTLKTGDWIYFTNKGDKVAFGNYKNGYKFGIWTYYNKKENFKIKWTEKNRPDEKFEFDKKGNLIVIDIIYSAPCFHYYRNGMPTMTARAL